MKYCIQGTIKAFDSSDLEIISKYYFKRFLKYKSENECNYDTGYIHNESIIHSLHCQVQERTLLKGIIALITGTYPEFGFEKFHIINEEGKFILSGVSQHLCVAPRSLLDVMNHQEMDATEIYLKAFEDLNLQWVLTLFARRIEEELFIGWSELYSIYEIIGKSIRSNGKN